jgi:hypothetical protein
VEKLSIENVMKKAHGLIMFEVVVGWYMVILPRVEG